MRLILSMLICCCASLAQAGPLDDAAVLYRAAAYSPTNTVIPNEGTRTEDLQLGSTLSDDANDPAFVEDADGKHLQFTSESFSKSSVPPSVVNGSVTFAIRYKPTGPLWNARLLLGVVDPNGGNSLKHFMLHQSTSNKYYSRFWGNDPNRSQLSVESSTSTSLSRIDTVVVSWDAATRTHRLYVNGTKEDESVESLDRSSATESGLNVPSNGINSLSPNGKVFAVASWTRAITDQEAADLTNDSVWKNETPPPPPPRPGELRVFIDGIEVPGSLILIDGVPVLPEGSNDKIVEVVTE